MTLRKFLPAAFLLAAGTSLLAGSTAGQDAPWGWLPPNVNSAYGKDVDDLYLSIMLVVLTAFFLTEGALVVFMFAFRARPGRKATYIHGSTVAELTWTVVPCGILIWLAVAQYDAWRNIRERFPKPEDRPVVVEVLANQFNWHYRQADEDGKFGTPGSNALTTTDVLHVPVNRKVICRMTSKDVIHSFFIPLARVKLDVVPGMMTKVWFEIDRIPVWKVTEVKERQLKGPGGKVEPTTVLLGQPAYLTESEFNAKRIALPQAWNEKQASWENRLRWDARVLEETMKKEYYYVVASPKALFRHGGSYEEGDAASAEYVFHHYEIACAELCGLGHTGMRSILHVEPADMYEKWRAEKAKYGESAEVSKFRDLWDKLYSKTDWFKRGVK